MAEDAPDESRDGLSRDVWLGGKLTLLQPKRGPRVGSDAALLAAACDPHEGRVADVGAGVGAVGLAIVSRNRGLTADLVEIDPAAAALAADNAALNGLGARIRVVNVDIYDRRARRAASLAEESAEAVATNPPYFDARAARVSPNAARALAYAFGSDRGETALDGWVSACLALLKPGGRFTMIHRPQALATILAAVRNRLGAVALLPVHPRAGEAAHRLLVSGIKGSKAPLRIAPPLILHEQSGKLTSEADAVHRGEKLLDWAA